MRHRSLQQPKSTRIQALGLFALLLVGALGENSFAANPIQLENAKPGTTSWQLSNPAVEREVEGYASLASVNRGGQIRFFVSVNTPQLVNIQIYRMGWYGGAGGRLLSQATISAIRQPMPTPDQHGLVECNWSSPITLDVPNSTSAPTDWVSGIYLAKLTAMSSGKQSYIIFAVRDDARIADFLYQASVTTYQAYNNWPYKRSCGAFHCPESRSLYSHTSPGTAAKVSFNRPFAVGLGTGSDKGVGAGEFLTSMQYGTSLIAASGEYNLVRWLEMKGYDVTYATNIDTHERADLLVNASTTRRKAFLSNGHDEYWSWEMRNRVEQARDRGVHLAFFSSNVWYWQVRFEPSAITGGTSRTMVGYKASAFTHDPYALDADSSNDHLITTLWRNAPVNRPEAAMVGVQYWGNSYWVDMVIKEPSHWLFSGTRLAAGESLPGLIGYEVDGVASSSPSNIQVVAQSPVLAAPPAVRYADTTVYTAPSGAVVLGAATNNWAWGLDNYNASDPSPLRPDYVHPKFQQAMSNLLARFLGDQFPVARAGGPYSGVPNTPVSFNAGGSSDADGTIVAYAWDFGDGTTGGGVSTSHAYSSIGSYMVTLVVVDDKGAAHSSSASVNISNTAPPQPPPPSPPPPPAPPPTALNAPSQLTAQRKGTSIEVVLNWRDNSNGEEFFRIERRSARDGTPYKEIARVGPNTTAYIDTQSLRTPMYYYRVRASSGSTFSQYSNAAWAGY